jgi:spermidine synthase
VFIKNVGKIGLFYFSNMAGSGIGGIAAVTLMWIFFPERLTIILSAIVFLSGIILIPKNFRLVFSFITVFVIAVLSYSYFNPPVLKISEYKSLSKTLNLPETKIIGTESSPYGLLHLISSPYLRYAPGLSITYPSLIMVNNAAFNNGEWTGPLINSENDSTNYFHFSTEHLPYITGSRENILILNSGTGRYIQHGLSGGAESITAVEPDKSLSELLTKKYANLADSVYNNPLVHLKNVYPRTYLLSTDSEFDLIQVPVVDAFGGTSGVYALQEQYLLTKEAFEDMYSKLSDDGVFCISTWLDYPYKNPLKLIATIAETLTERGIQNISPHIAAIKNWNTLTIMAKHKPFDQIELDKIRAFCKEMKFDPVILSGINEDERDYYNRLQDKSFYTYINQLLESQEKREELYTEYTFNIKPATDNQPYYSQFLQWKSISKLSETFGNQSLPFFEIGYVLLYLTFIQILLLAFILIILPLFKTCLSGRQVGWKGKNKLKIILYFSGIGLGYMFIEIIFIQKFTLYFGNVIYAAAAVVSLMLIASGLGSLVSQKIKTDAKKISGILSIIIISLIAYTLIHTPLLKMTIIFSFPVKIIFTILLIAPPAFFMGMPFPLGLRLLASKNESAEREQLPWAWGINGVFSVTGAVSATIIAVEFGFIWVMVLAAVAYFITLITSLYWN